MSVSKERIEYFVSLLIASVVIIIMSIIYFAIVLIVVKIAADLVGFDDLDDSFGVLSASILVLAILVSSALHERT
ncbi:MAG: hypothetical protein Q6362_004620 [Candidatus Wukongarchaeota archaeon]|nr:hypothetical protein [Candidatus Wukongarchaeota archaeon]